VGKMIATDVERFVCKANVKALFLSVCHTGSTIILLYHCFVALLVPFLLLLKILYCMIKGEREI